MASTSNDEVERLAPKRFGGRLATVSERDFVPTLVEHDAEELPHASLIIDHENARLSH